MTLIIAGFVALVAILGLMAWDRHRMM